MSKVFINGYATVKEVEEIIPQEDGSNIERITAVLERVKYPQDYDTALQDIQDKRAELDEEEQKIISNKAGLQNNG